MDADVAEEIARRYGTHRPVRRAVIVVACVVLAGAGLGWLAWAAWFQANPAVQAEVAAFDVQDAHRVETTLQLRFRDRYVTGTCLLRASAEDHAVVGELDLPVRGTGPREQVVQVRTERQATTVEVVRCVAD